MHGIRNDGWARTALALLWLASGCGVGGDPGGVPGPGDGGEGAADADPSGGASDDQALPPGATGAGAGGAEGSGGDADADPDPDADVDPDPDADADPDPDPGNRARWIQIETTDSPSWVAWHEIEVYVGGHNVAPGAQLVASTTAAGEPPEWVVDGDLATGWNSGDFAPATLALDLGQVVSIDRVRLRVKQRPAGPTHHTLLLGAAEDSLRLRHVWQEHTADGEWLEVDLSGASPRAPDSIFDPQRSQFWAAGDVHVQGARFMVEDRVYYPKTDFLTPVGDGDDIIGWNTLNYLSYAPHKRAAVRDALIAQRYNSVYIYTLTEGVDFAGGGQPVTPYGSGGFSFDTADLNLVRVREWQGAVEELIAHDIKPILWLAGDDSRTIAGKPFSDWQTYVQHMVDAFEGYPVMWVVGLEADEYWTAEQAVRRTRDLIARTARPVGIHLTIDETSRPDTPYKEGAHFVMGQLRSPQGDDDYRAQVRAYHMADRPWVASEFNVFDRGGEATVNRRSNAIGRVIAEVGDPPLVAGIGNGIDLSGDPAGSDPSADPDPEPEPEPEPDPDPGPGNAPPFDLDEVVWLHTDVSDWPVTAHLSEVRVDAGQICLDYDKADVWPVGHIEGVAVVANPWVFIPHEGRWYGATWEWLRPGQTCKNRHAVAGDHIKQAPFGPMNWQPVSGETYYFMVSGLARIGGITNVSERSNLVEVVWP